jgi:hypothetical protein
MEHAAFNATYYATVAQVIPVLFLAAVASRYWDGHEHVLPERNVALLAVVAVAFVGELSALEALSTQEKPSSIENLAITFGYILPALFVFLNFGAGPWIALTASWPERLKKHGQDIYAAVVLISVALYFVFDVDPGELLAAAAVVLIVAPSVIKLARDFRKLKGKPLGKGSGGSDRSG